MECQSSTDVHTRIPIKWFWELQGLLSVSLDSEREKERENEQARETKSDREREKEKGPTQNMHFPITRHKKTLI